MTPQILQKLNELEVLYNIKILYACESGSRSWGFDSINSDWDIRFIYVHKLSWYLGTQNNKDTIERMEGLLDFSGWELKKALNLLAKGNPPIIEWFNSPIVYLKDPDFFNDFTSLINTHFSPRTAIYHYLGMAKRNYNQYIRDRAYVSIKKYLYIIRPLLCCIAIQEQGKMPSTDIDVSLSLIERYEACKHIVQLIESKKAGKELDMGPHNKVLNDFIEETMFFFDLYVSDLKGVQVDYKALDQCLYKQILDFTNEV